MPVNPFAIVDAIATDLPTVVGLTPKKARKYQEPEVFDLATDLPCLAVWTEDTDYIPIDTAGAYARIHHFTVAWYVFFEGVNKHGFDVDTMAQKLDDTRELLVARIAGYSQGVPGYGNQLLGMLTRSRLEELETAGMWRITVDFDVADNA